MHRLVMPALLAFYAGALAFCAVLIVDIHQTVYRLESRYDAHRECKP